MVSHYMRILVLTIILSSCAPIVNSDTFSLIKGCFESAIENALNEKAITECVKSAGGKLTNEVLKKLTDYFNQLSTESANQAFTSFFSVETSPPNQIGDNRVVSNLIVEKIKVIHE